VPEIVPVSVPGKRGQATVVSTDEHPRETSLEALAKLPTPFRAGGTVTGRKRVRGQRWRLRLDRGRPPMR